MIKKLRIFYWKQRDKGKGKQAILLFCLVGALIIFSLYSIGNAYIAAQTEDNEEIEETQATGSSISGSAVSEEAINEKTVSPVAVTENPLPTDTPLSTATAIPTKPPEKDVEGINIDGLRGFGAFMTDSAYNKLKAEITKICKDNGYSSAKKLTYQDEGTVASDIISYISFAKKVIYSCNYSLKTNEYTLNKTSLTEDKLKQQKEKKEKAEKEKLKKEQEKAKAKAEAERKKEYKKILAKRKAEAKAKAKAKAEAKAKAKAKAEAEAKAKAKAKANKDIYIEY